MSICIRSGILIAIFVFAGLFTAAEAQQPKRKNPMVRTDGLPQVQFNVSPLQADIIDESPIIRDMRRRPESGIDLDGMLVPGLPETNSGGAYNSNPAGNRQPGNRSLLQITRGSNGMIPNLGRLPRSGFGTQPNANTGAIHPPAGLPAGFNTGIHMEGTLKPPALTNSANSGNAANLTVNNSPKPTSKTATYGDNYARAGSAQSGAGNGANTRVNGVIKNSGVVNNMLKRQP